MWHTSPFSKQGAPASRIPSQWESWWLGNMLHLGGGSKIKQDKKKAEFGPWFHLCQGSISVPFFFEPRPFWLIVVWWLKSPPNCQQIKNVAPLPTSTKESRFERMIGHRAVQAFGSKGGPRSYGIRGEARRKRFWILIPGRGPLVLLWAL